MVGANECQHEHFLHATTAYRWLLTKSCVSLDTLHDDLVSCFYRLQRQPGRTAVSPLASAAASNVAWLCQPDRHGLTHGRVYAGVMVHAASGLV
jgi:hypothetical protein